MKQERMLARIGYNDERDAFELLTSTDGGDTWGLVVSCACVKRAGEKEGGEPEYIHYSLLNELRHAVDLGYKVV